MFEYDRADPESEPVAARLLMATSLRLQIFARQQILPAMEAHLDDVLQRLDRIASKRHAVDLVLADARSRWRTALRPALVRDALAVLVEDAAIAGLLADTETGRAQFDSEAGRLIAAEIERREDYLTHRLTGIRAARLTLH